MRFPSVEERVGIQFTATPLALLLAEFDPSRREHILGLVSVDVREALATFVQNGVFVFPQELHVALATA